MNNYTNQNSLQNQLVRQIKDIVNITGIRVRGNSGGAINVDDLSLEATQQLVKTALQTLATIVNGSAEAKANIQIGGSDVSAINPFPVDATLSLSSPSAIDHIYNGAISNVSATQIDATTHSCTTTYVTASELNTGWVRVGGSTVTATTGAILYAGESIEIPIDDSNKLYAIAEVNGEAISVSYFN